MLRQFSPCRRAAIFAPTLTAAPRVRTLASRLQTSAATRMTLTIANESDSGRWDSEVEVAIAGAGGAGLEAALAAAAAGAGAIVFEKQPRIWESSTAISVGRNAFAGTHIQQRPGGAEFSALFY